jgi:DNA-binding transcriptional regulator YiaG
MSLEIAEAIFATRARLAQEMAPQSRRASSACRIGRTPPKQERQFWERLPVHDLYALRTAIYLSAERVAAQCRVSVYTYRNWEQGKTNPDAHHRHRLSRVLRVSERRLLDPEAVL